MAAMRLREPLKEGYPPGRGGIASPRSSIQDRVSFDGIRYANCWEDADVLCTALHPRRGARILSIASSGDNALALAAAGAEVVAVDLSAAQLACLELRRAAFRRLDHPGVLAFLGVRESRQRLSTCRQLERDLSPPARQFWERNRRLVEAGAIHAGRFEAYLRCFRRRLLPLVHSRRTVASLLEKRGPAARREFHDRLWNTLRWRLLFRVFFGRFLLGRLGRDPEFLRYAGGPVAERLLERARHGLTDLPTHANPYLEYILTGTFDRALPRYLEPERFDDVRAGLDRLTLHRGPVEEAARMRGGAGFDGFNLSDIFEYLDPDSCRRIYAELLEAARPRARLAYWNLLVPRRRPDEFADRVVSLDGLAAKLHAVDRAFFYGDLVVEELPEP